MPLPYDNSAAVVVLPALRNDMVIDRRLRRWLARGAVSVVDGPHELLASVLAPLRVPCPDEGLAALRMWGQTGERPTVWIAAADPVYLEPRLDHLCLHALQGEQMPATDLRIIFDYLQTTLAEHQRYGFARVGDCGYVRADRPLATARLPARAVDQQLPNEYLPRGDRTGSYHRLRSEVEMALHDHLCLHALQGEQMPATDLRIIFDYLQTTLADHQRYGFARVGDCGYVRADRPLATARLPARAVDQQLPNEYLPRGDRTGSYHRLRSEVEMALHDHEVNLRRAAAGMPPVNSLWLWGGGYAPEQTAEPLPPLFADDPLLRGCWLSKAAVVAGWPGSIANCLDSAAAGFVAVPQVADNVAAGVESCLADLRDAVRRRRISSAILVLGDGHVIRVRRADRWKFWRKAAPLSA